ncbi:50S ribosomal protein L13 [Desulfobaculum bizertense]|uniref:Large ribosomal subunit protein uL13 n=1 Tax=Desulfobaculum bizertense DSM 18034 TaxID=1121442 RepID=A0A1T4VVM6_9BACT|nr:50S ribosomal protein L13 [Desulfobaculum bizertense]UIJ36725.1 50S ribosomal protein L13 [Desulfobaculum bizertense]SKA69052.1 LSU ribosomal protein L13P [Desulfobaculum bizertense DSM 18034]
MKTYSPKPEEITHEWFVVDAEDKILGRLATEIATRLRGKHKAEFAPHVDCGDFVVVINAEKIKVTGNKLDQKMYYHHTGYPGGIREASLKVMLEKKPEDVIIKAVRGMLPKNRLSTQLLAKLKVYAGPEHPHTAQQPKPLDF